MQLVRYRANELDHAC